MDKRNALGKGLSALIPEAPMAPPPADAPVTELDIEALAPNDLQPRLQMDDARLEELAASIRSHGVIQPIVVRKAGDGYRIVAGERRWRAAKRAGLTRVPVVVKDVGGERASQDLLELALIRFVRPQHAEVIAGVASVQESEADRARARLPLSAERPFGVARGDPRVIDPERGHERKV